MNPNTPAIPLRYAGHLLPANAVCPATPRAGRRSRHAGRAPDRNRRDRPPRRTPKGKSMAVYAWPFVLLSAAILLAPASAPVLARLRPSPAHRRVGSRKPVAAADPVASATLFDLLAACLRAGLPTAAALRAVAPAATDSLSDRLLRVADLLALGADPAVAWAPTESGARAAPEFDALARLARRSARSGSSLAAAIGELAEERRTQVEEAATARAERAGVLIGGPLGLCFLPAFICLGIVPVIIGLAGGALGGGLL